MEKLVHNNQKSFLSISMKTIQVHTVTYFLIGLIAFSLFDYSSKYADPTLGNYMRQTTHPLVAYGSIFQVLRGLLFGIVFYTLKDVIFARKNGWLVLWLMLFLVGVVLPFRSSPGSIEGLVNSTVPLWFHIISLPEVFVQTFLLAIFTHYWVNNPDRKWIGWGFGILFVLALLMSILGVLASLRIIPATGI